MYDYIHINIMPLNKTYLYQWNTIYYLYSIYFVCFDNYLKLKNNPLYNNNNFYQSLCVNK